MRVGHRVGLTLLVAAGVILSGATNAQVTYKLGAAVPLLDASFYTTHQAFFGQTSHDGKRVAFWAVNNATSACSFFIVDIGDPTSFRRITPEYPGVAPNTPISWTPNDSALFVAGYRIPIPPLGEYQPIQPWPIHGISVQDVSATSLPGGNWEIAQKRFGGLAEIVALPILADGSADPARQPVFLTDFGGSSIRPDWIAVSPDATVVAFADFHGSVDGIQPDTGDVYVLKNIPAILAAPLREGTNISSLAPLDANDSNVVAIRTTDTDNFAEAPGFSQDGSLLIYTEDYNNVFRDTDFLNTFALGDFDIMVSNADGSGGDYRLAQAGNQGFVSSTPGGVRIVYNSAEGPLMHLFMSTIEVVTPVTGTDLGNNDIVTVAPQSAQDGSGTVVTIPASTTIDFPPGAEQKIEVLTPVDPVTPVQLPPDIDAIPVLRDFGPDDTHFNPSITVTITYTDAEVEGLNENLLRVFLFNPISGVYDQEITSDIVRDPANNRISFSVDHFSVYGLGAAVDTDGDGILDSGDPDDDNDGVLDGVDPMPLDTDNDGVNNADDADDDSDGIADFDDAKPLDTDNDGLNNDADADDDNDGILDTGDAFLFDTNNNGQINAVDPDDDGDGLSDTDETYTHHTNPLSPDSDGDGVTDGDEITAGTDPNEPPTPQMPVASLASLLAAAAVLGGIGVRRVRARKQ